MQSKLEIMILSIGEMNWHTLKAKFFAAFIPDADSAHCFVKNLRFGLSFFNKSLMASATSTG